MDIYLVGGGGAVMGMYLVRGRGRDVRYMAVIIGGWKKYAKLTNCNDHSELYCTCLSTYCREEPTSIFSAISSSENSLGDLCTYDPLPKLVVYLTNFTQNIPKLHCIL